VKADTLKNPLAVAVTVSLTSGVNEYHTVLVGFGAAGDRIVGGNGGPGGVDGVGEWRRGDDGSVIEVSLAGGVAAPTGPARKIPRATMKAMAALRRQCFETSVILLTPKLSSSGGANPGRDYQEYLRACSDTATEGFLNDPVAGPSRGLLRRRERRSEAP
jgi:hypothetical protein